MLLNVALGQPLCNMQCAEKYLYLFSWSGLCVFFREFIVYLAAVHILDPRRHKLKVLSVHHSMLPLTRPGILGNAPCTFHGVPLGRVNS